MAKGHPKLNQDNVWRRRGFLAVLLCIAFGSLGIWAWQEVLKDHFVPLRFGVVDEGSVYRSGLLSTSLVKKILVQHNIRIIISLTEYKPGDSRHEAERQAAREWGTKIVRFPLRGDGVGNVEKYAKAIATIVDAKKKNWPVLVHCTAGTQRTGGVLAAYRLLVQRHDPAFVIEELQRYDWDPEDDHVLLRYLNINMADLAARLVEMGVIREIPNPIPKLPMPE